MSHFENLSEKACLLENLEFAVHWNRKSCFVIKISKLIDWNWTDCAEQYLQLYSVGLYACYNLCALLSRCKCQKQPPEVFYKKMFWKNSQNSEGKTCATVSFLIKFQASGLQLNWKRDSDTGVLLWSLWNFQEHFFYRTPSNDFFWNVAIHHRLTCTRCDQFQLGSRKYFST